MSNFKCEICGTDICEDRNTGKYITECEHYPIEDEIIEIKPSEPIRGENENIKGDI